MSIIAFDVSKSELVGVKINKRGAITDTYVVPNSPTAIDQFLHTVSAGRIKIGSEATGEYHNALARMCIERSIPFYLLNPIVTKQFTKATVRKRKTDLTDAHVIAKCLLQGEGYRVDISAFASTKSILRTASELSQIAVSVRHSLARFKAHLPAEALVRSELARVAETITAAVRNLREHGADRVDPRLSKLLCSIPGVGPVLAAIVISEIGAITRFESAKALAAYAGLDPKIRQSGGCLKRNTAITKRGSPHLRRALFVAASIAQRHDPEMKTYFVKKKSEGKRYTEATVANARHILYRIYAVWRRGTPYVIHRPT